MTLDIGPVPAGVDPAEWAAARPFLDRFVFRARSGAVIIVDEVNWWPLLFPFKCRLLLAPEAANLSGADVDHLRLCRKAEAPFHAWLKPDEVERLIKARPRSGGGDKANRYLKLQIMNWGIADAVIALGPMQDQLHRMIDSAFGEAAKFEGRGVTGQQFVVISESLGSFVVMDAFNAAGPETAKTRDVLSATSDLYFFANQFALLDLGRANGLPPRSPTAQTKTNQTLQAWAQSDRRVQRRQVVAFSDPSDILTWYVPALTDLDGREIPVANLYVRNRGGFSIPDLWADPVRAHTGHSGNLAVLDWMFDGAEPARASAAK